MDKKAFEELQNRNWEDDYWKKITALPAVTNFNYSLPASNDHQEHSTEIKVNPLPVGTYMLLASADENFTLSKNILAAQFFHVSNIAWMHNGTEFFVVNRESGQPLAKATIVLWEGIYNYDQRVYIQTKADTYTSNANGNFRITKAPGKNSYNRTLEVSFEKDNLHLDDRAYSYVYEGKKEPIDEKKERRIFFFTDRSIYRPGQAVYFKGIVTTKDARTGKPKITEGLKSTIILYDANGEKIDSMEVTSNAFGSYAGKFVLPLGRMNGNYHLQETLTAAAVNFSVEEYKRPKFYAEYQPVSKSYRVNDQITVTGNAKAYAGNNIDAATVKYRVTRVARFLYPWMLWRWPMPQTQPLEIINGEIKTGTDGKFSIEFEAIPDLSIDKKTEPVFDYKVEADITDINGETRSATAIVPVGYKALNLQVNLSSEPINIDSLKQIFISTKNLFRFIFNIDISIYCSIQYTRIERTIIQYFKCFFNIIIMS